MQVRSIEGAGLGWGRISQDLNQSPVSKSLKSALSVKLTLVCTSNGKW